MLVRKEILDAYRDTIARLPAGDRLAIETYVNILKGQVIHLKKESDTLSRILHPDTTGR